MYRALVMSTFRLFYPHQAIVTSLLKWLRILPSEQALCVGCLHALRRLVCCPPVPPSKCHNTGGLSGWVV